MKRTAVLIIFVLLFVCAAAAQNAKAIDISALADAGRISGDKYANPILGITIVAPNGTLEANPLVNKEAGRARLLQILSKSGNTDDTYTFAVLADTVARYSQLHSPAQYVRSVRHQMESAGYVTVREEFPIEIGGLHFTGAILREATPSGRAHVRGMYTTFRDGLIISFDAEAATEDKLNQLVERLVTFEH